MNENIPYVSRKSSRRDKAREWCIKQLVFIVVVAAFVVLFVPQYVAPQLLGMTPQQIEANPWLITTLAGVLAIPVSYVVSKILIRRK